MNRPLPEPPPNIRLPERDAGAIDRADRSDDLDAHRPPLPNGMADRRPKRKPKRPSKGGPVR
jgi:hypothetical protein